MSRINLLPDHFVARRRRAQVVVRAAAAGVLMVITAAAWGGIAHAQLSARSARIAAARLRLEQEQQRGRAIEARGAEYRTLRAMLAHRSQLESPVAPAGVLTLLTHLLPDSVALTRLSVEVPDPDMSDHSEKPATATAPAKASAPTHVILEGLALSDVQLTQVVSALAAQKAFVNVKLVRSRQVPLGTVTRFGFEITLDVPATESAGAAGIGQGVGAGGERGA